MNWGKWIVLSFILFAVFIGILVAVCFREDISLVSKEYYSEELVFQKQIERLMRTDGLKEKPLIRIADHMVIIQFNQFPNFESGEFRLFRPSDKRYDKDFMLVARGDTTQRFDVSMLPPGMYKAKLKWSMHGREFYFEEVIHL